MDAPASLAPPNKSEAPSTTRRRSPLRALLSFIGTFVVLGVMAYVLAQHSSEISRAAARADLMTLVIVTALAFLTLVARSEAVVACLTAMGDRPPRVDIHAASSVTFLISTVNHYVASFARAALLIRLDGDRAPTIPQMVLVDASTMLIEGLVAAVLIFVSASTLRLAWWMPPVAVLGALGGLAAALVLTRRFRRHPIFRGLGMLAHSRQRLIVVSLTIALFVCQIGRTLIVLRVTGLHPTLLQATATFVAGGVLSSLFAGPGAGAAGAPLIVFGHRNIGAAAAAGLFLSSTTVLAAALYAICGGPVYLKRMRRRAAKIDTEGVRGLEPSAESPDRVLDPGQG